MKVKSTTEDKLKVIKLFSQSGKTSYFGVEYGKLEFKAQSKRKATRIVDLLVAYYSDFKLLNRTLHSSTGENLGSFTKKSLVVLNQIIQKLNNSNNNSNNNEEQQQQQQQQSQQQLEQQYEQLQEFLQPSDDYLEQGDIYQQVEVSVCGWDEGTEARSVGECLDYSYNQEKYPYPQYEGERDIVLCEKSKSTGTDSYEFDFGDCSYGQLTAINESFNDGIDELARCLEQFGEEYARESQERIKQRDRESQERIKQRDRESQERIEQSERELQEEIEQSERELQEEIEQRDRESQERIAEFEREREQRRRNFLSRVREQRRARTGGV